MYNYGNGATKITRNMSEGTQELWELCVYGFTSGVVAVGKEFFDLSRHDMGGIAKREGCNLEFRCQVQFRPGSFVQDRLDTLMPSELRRHGISESGSCVLTFLVGNDKGAVERARDEIYRVRGKVKNPHGRAEQSYLGAYSS